MHPHIAPDSACENGLITPDLWLRNCKSPEPYERDDSSPLPFDSAKIGDRNIQTSPLPLITVTPSSKLMPQAAEPCPLNLHNGSRSKSVIKNKKNRTSNSGNRQLSPSNDLPQDLRVRHASPGIGSTENVKIDAERTDERLQNSNHNNSNLGQQNTTNNKAQFSTFNNPNIFPEPSMIPPQFFNTQNTQNFEKFFQHSRNLLSPFNRTLPPVTVMVPYPVLIPIPLPIPIPIQMSKIWPNGASESKGENSPEKIAPSLVVQSQDTSQISPDESALTAESKVNDSSQNREHVSVVEEEVVKVETADVVRPLRKRKKPVVETVRQIAKPVVKSKKSV